MAGSPCLNSLHKSPAKFSFKSIAVITGLSKERAFLYNAFLNSRYFGVTDFNTQITPRDHDPVGLADNLIDIFDRFVPFYLGDNTRCSANILKKSPCFPNVFCAAHIGSITKT